MKIPAVIAVILAVSFLAVDAHAFSRRRPRSSVVVQSRGTTVVVQSGRVRHHARSQNVVIVR